MNKLARTLNDRDLALIRNFLLGGAALGGAAGLGTSFANYLQTLKKEQPSTADDDDVLYLKAPPTKMAVEKSAVVGGGLALAGGTLAAVGSYALARKLYQAMKRKRIQEELDRAQQGYSNIVTTEAKAAAEGKPMSFTEFLTSAPVAVPLLLGVGSGILANKALSQAFPPRRKRLRTGPRKVVLLRDGEQVPDPEQEELLKPASYDSDDADEMLLNIVLGMSKEATDFTDLIAALAQGSAAEMRHIAQDHGTNVMLDLVKGASLNTPSDTSTALAVSFAVKSAEFRPVAMILAAAEFADRCPVFFKLAQTVDETTAEALTGMMSYLGAASRRQTFLPHVKEAAMPMAGAGMNPQALEVLLALQQLQKGVGGAAPPQQGPGGIAQHDEGLMDSYDSEASTADPGAKKDNAQDDMIDQILSGNADEQDSEGPVHEKEEQNEDLARNKQTFNTPEV